MFTVGTQRRVPQVQLSAPQSDLHVPAAPTALASLVRCPRVILSAPAYAPQ